MIRSRRGLITAGVITFLVGIVVLFPARVAYHWFAPSELAVSNIAGTLWSGSAGEASAGQLYLHDLRWRMRPSALLSGGLGFRVEAKPVSGFIDGTVIAGAGGAVKLRELTASMPLEILGPALNVTGLSGSASLQFARLEFDTVRLFEADGTLTVGNLNVPLISRESLGGYRAEFSTQSSAINATIEDTDGVVDLAATLLILPDRSYDLTGLVIATPATPSALRRQMELLGPENARGQRELRFGGSY